jgi:Bacteriophage tail sheath protein
MPISQLGQLNTTALQVADVYVQIVPPQFLLNGVPSNIAGLVGSAQWGPVDQPVIVGNMAEFGANFGRPQARQHDLGSHAGIVFQQGAHAIKCVRVTDGNDVAASKAVQTNCITFTSKYTGSRGNDIKVTVGTGSKAATHLVKVGMPGLVPEIFDNIHQGVHTVAIGGSGGTGYTSAPVVEFSASDIPGGRTAKGYATVADGAVASVVVTDPGEYSSAPTASLTGGGGSDATATPAIDYWPNVARAINQGINGARGASNFIVATLGAGTTTPAAATVQLAGGTDGANGIVAADMLGVDTLPRTGLYALRGQNVSVATLVDVTDSTTWATQDAFGLSEGIYMVVTGPAGQSISAAQSVKASSGADSYALKVMLGDWVYWNDTFNAISERLMSPAAFALGMLASLSPQHSTLNKRMLGVVATEKTKTGLPYTAADLQELALSGIEVITNPCPGGNYFGCRSGRNASSNAVIHGDNYTRMTNYLATTLERGMGIYVGQLQSRKPNDETRRRAKATLDAFLTAMVQQNQIDEFQVVLDRSNNPDQRIALGYMQADVKVVYLSVVEYFLINLEGGQSVEIQRQSTDFALAA